VVGDTIITVTIQDTLKELVKKRGLRKVASELGIDHGQLYRSINSDLRVSTLQAILNLFGYDLKIVKRREVKSGKEKPSGQDGERSKSQ
jgi:DNA-binding phage protein